LTEDTLEKTVATGRVPTGYEAHIGHLLDEAPASLVVTAVEEAAARECKTPTDIWRNVAMLAKNHADTRRQFGFEENRSAAGAMPEVVVTRTHPD
jgi:hypothetical protein